VILTTISPVTPPVLNATSGTMTAKLVTLVATLVQATTNFTDSREIIPGTTSTKEALPDPSNEETASILATMNAMTATQSVTTDDRSTAS
jgi:hypothetical protein